MKKTIKSIIVATTTLLTTNNVSSQINVSSQETAPIKISSAMMGHIVLSYKIYPSDNGDTTYFITFTDCQYQYIRSRETIHYTGKINYLYNVLLAQLYSDKGTYVTATIGSDDVTIRTYKNLGSKIIYIYLNKGSYFTLTEYYLNVLFNR